MEKPINEYLYEGNLEIVDYLKKSRLFGHLSDDMLEQLVPLSEFVEYPKDTEILIEGQENGKVFFLIQGEVGVYAKGEFILKLKRKGDIFGEMSVISSKPCSATVIAHTPVTVFGIIAQGIGSYTNLNSDSFYNFFYRVFAMILTEKLTLTTGKARQFELTNRLLEKTKKSLELQIEEQKQTENERLQLETQLHRSQKIEAIGTLAGGIAHDFNNLLFAMIGYITMAKEDLTDDSPIKENLEEALNAARRAKDLVRQILAFSHHQEGEHRPIRIAPLIKEALNLIRASLPATIEITEKIENDDGSVLADPSQIHQVIMNLCTNAGHAMNESGGVLAVELAETEIDPQFASSHQLREGRYLILSVGDTGCGINSKDLTRIFDPFFTTKPVDQGTGMGLSVVHGIVHNTNGTIAVASKPGKGTVFNVYLPKIESSSVTDKEEAEAMPRGSEHILVIDDEKPLVKLEKQILERCGYRVAAANDGFEALDLFQERPDYFDLVITDQTMPRMTGTQLAEKLISIRPDLKIILVTGFNKTISVDQAKSIGIREYIMKPITPNAFSLTIRRILDDQAV